MKKKLIIGLLACSNPAMANDIKASIKITEANGYLHIAPLVENTGTTPIQQWEYRLAISKKSQSGSSTSQQSGQFTLSPGSKQHLSQARFNQGKDEHYHFDLSLWYQGKLMLETQKSHP